MVAEELFISGQRVELRPNTVTRNLQINNLGEVKDYMANYSNTIQLPKTPHNVEVFDFLGVNGSRSIAPYRQLHARYIVNGVPLIVNGYAVVKATSQHYEVVVYDGNKDLAERIKGKTLRDLNYSDLNHYLTPQAYEASLSHTEGYTYAIGDFLPRTYFGTIRIEEQAPSIFVKTLWDKIFAEAGLAYSGPFFTENTDFQCEVITPSTGYPVENIELDATDMGTATTNTIFRNEQSTDPLMRFTDQHTFESGNFDDATIYPDGTATIHNAGQISINITTSFNNFQSNVRLHVRRNGSTVANIGLEPGQSPLVTEVNLTVESGDELSFWIYASYSLDQVGGDPGQIDGEYRVNYSASSVIQMESLTGGQLIDFAQFVPDMQQIDFIKDVMRRYGLIFKSVNNYEGYQFIQFETLLNDREGAQDWGDKLSVIQQERYDIDYARRNIASYQYPEEIVEHIYDGVLTIDNENAEPEKELFTSPYEIAVRRPRPWQSQWIYQVPLWEEKEEDEEIIKEPQETPPKIFRLQRRQINYNAFFFDNTASIPISGNIPFLSLHNMEMQYFIGRYWKAFQNLVNRPKQVDAILNLSEVDVYTLDFFKLKFLPQTGRFYYLNSVRHTPGMLNKAELIEIHSFATNQPPTTLGVYSFTMNYEQTRNITVENITYQANPAYFDPEFDEPHAIMFTGGFNSNVLLKQGNEVITSQTEILVDDWDVSIEDAGNTTDAHNAAFTFRIMDKGSGKWSEVEGTVEVSIRQFNNQPPFADAG